MLGWIEEARQGFLALRPATQPSFFLCLIFFTGFFLFLFWLGLGGAGSVYWLAAG
jgi:hypothetical protein